MKYRLVRYTFRFVKSQDKYTDIPSKYFVCLHKIFKRSSRHVFKTSSRRLQRNNFSSSKTSSRRLQDVLEDVKLLRWRRVEDVFKTCLQDVFKTCLQDVFSVTIFRLPRRLQNVFARRLQDVLEDVKLSRWRRVKGVFKTCFETLFKTPSRPTNVCWERCACNYTIARNE